MMLSFPKVRLGSFLKYRKEHFTLDDSLRYKRVRVQLHNRGIVLRDVVAGAELRTKRQQVVRAGDFLVAEIDAKVGGFGIIPAEVDGAIVSSHYFLFQIDETQCQSGWLNAFIRAGGLEEQVKARGTTNYAAIRPEHILDFEIPLPPLPEQRRIVARIEELAAKIEEARGLRRGSIIQTDALESSATAEAFASLSRAPRLSIQELAEVRGGIQKGPHRAAGSNPVRYLTVAHVQRNYICLSDPRFFEVSPEELERWRLEAGDVLIIEGNGSPAQIGRAALFRGEIPDCVHQNHVIRIRPNRKLIDREFLSSYLNSPPGQDEVHSQSRTTIGLRNLSIGRIKEIAVPVPPLDRQHRIAGHVAAMQAKLRELRRVQAETAAELDALLPSVLGKAFRGEL
jgi:type I restriction enzyme S subunit